jgi:putative transposase
LCHLFKDLHNITRRGSEKKRYAGKRLTRHFFKTRTGAIINADVDAGYNIIKKAVPNAVSVDGIEDVGLHPYSVAIS